MVALLYFIIYIANIICIICINSKYDSLMSPLIKKFYPSDMYEKLFTDYNINIQIKEDENNIKKEFLINTSYISDEIFFDFKYSGEIFSLNDSNLNFPLTEKYINKIFLINSNKTFKDFIEQSKPLLRFLTRIIIIPKNSLDNINIIAKYILYDYSILLLEVDEIIFNELKNLDEKETINIISKKLDIFPFKQLYKLSLIIFFVLLVCSLIYNCFLKILKIHYNREQISFFESIKYELYFKSFVLVASIIDFESFINEKGIILELTSFLKSLIIFIMIFNKLNYVSFFQIVYYGRGIKIQGKQIYKILMSYLSAFNIVFYILFNIFINPFKIPRAFYILSIFVSIPIFSLMGFFSIRNLLFLLKSLSKVRKAKNNNGFTKVILLKLFIVILQILVLIIYFYFYLSIHKYLIFKKGFCFKIEKDILFQCLESSFLCIISIIYFPRKWPQNFNKYIAIIQEPKKGAKINISDENNYKSSLSNNNLENENDIKGFIRKNYRNYFVVINPKAFLASKKDDDNNNINIENNKKKKLLIPDKIKIGKLLRI